MARPPKKKLNEKKKKVANWHTCNLVIPAVQRLRKEDQAYKSRMVEWLKWYSACLASMRVRIQTPVTPKTTT
jgi:hypothetical protein